MAKEDEIVEELREIKFHLSLLTHEIRSKALGLFEREVLKTDARIEMFHALNDEKNTMQVAAAAGVTRQAALNLLHDLEAGGFISVRTEGQAQIARPNLDGILDWYYSRSS